MWTQILAILVTWLFWGWCLGAWVLWYLTALGMSRAFLGASAPAVQQGGAIALARSALWVALLTVGAVLGIGAYLVTHQWLFATLLGIGAMLLPMLLTLALSGMDEG